MKIKKYLKKHPDLPPAVREVLREAVAFVESGGDDPVSLALAVADMLTDKKKPAPVVTAAATPTTYATVGAYPTPPLPYYPPSVRSAGGEHGEP